MSSLSPRLRWLTEVVGAIAIILSLVFVGLELNESTKATRAATSSAASQAMMEWYSDIGTDPEAAKLFVDFIQRPESLTQSQRVQGVFMLHSALLVFQNAYFLAVDGTLDESTQATILEAIVPIKDAPGFRFYWDQRKAYFSPAFQAYIEELIEVERNTSAGLYTPEGD